MPALEKVPFIKGGIFSPLGCIGVGGLLYSDKLRKSSNGLLTNFNYLQVVVDCKEKIMFYLEMFQGGFF